MNSRFSSLLAFGYKWMITNSGSVCFNAASCSCDIWFLLKYNSFKFFNSLKGKISLISLMSNCKELKPLNYSKKEIYFILASNKFKRESSNFAPCNRADKISFVKEQ